MKSDPKSNLLPHDEARVEYGRLLWKNPTARARLLKHWRDPRHPYSESFVSKWEPLVIRMLSSSAENDSIMESELRTQGLSFRVVVRQIPPVFGSFY